MTEEQTENLFRSLEGGDGGIEAFLNLPGDDRAWVMAVLEQRAAAEEIRQIVNSVRRMAQWIRFEHSLRTSHQEKLRAGIATCHYDSDILMPT